MGRRYTVPFTAISVSAAGAEMIAYTCPSNKTAFVKEICLKNSNVTLPTAQDLAVVGKVFTTSSGGTGGTAVTPQKTDQGDAAASGSAAAGNTVANSGSVGSTPYRDSFYLYQGLDKPLPGEKGIALSNSMIFAVSLVNATAGAVAVTFDGYLVVEECG